MNLRHIWAIARKDLREAMGNTSVVLPMAIVPLIFIIILPLAVLLIPTHISGGIESMTRDKDLQLFMNNMPPAMMGGLSGLNSAQLMITLMLGYFFAPMLLIIPLMFATTIAAESFAGERERKTMEALIYSPATDLELFLGKMLAGLAPAVLLTWASFVIYIIVLNVAGWPIFGRIWFPLPHWWPMMFWVAPALALAGVSITVLISSKVKTFQGAYQSSASSVVLVLALVAGQALGVVYLSISLGLLMGLFLFLLDAVLIWFAVKIFNRKALLAS